MQTGPVIRKCILVILLSSVNPQEGLAKATLVKWTKGFSCSGVEGEDVCQLLREAIARRGDVKIDVCAVLNDTTGCLMSCAWKEPHCRIGLILGTGTNACYLERINDIHTVEDRAAFTGQKYMVVNTEWGAFGDSGELDFVRTKWDRNVDALSVNPGRQVFEKMISGMYMGELIRQVLVDLMKDHLIFLDLDCNTSKLRERGEMIAVYISLECVNFTHYSRHAGSFLTRFASEIESDPVGDYTRAKKCLDELGMDSTSVTDEDYSALRHVSKKVSI